MKLLVSSLLLVSATSAFVMPQQNELAKPILSGHALTDYVNKAQQLWTAELPSITLESVKRRLMDPMYVAVPEGVDMAPEIDLVGATIPASFDARAQWKNCPSISYIRDQSDCGSCWSFGAAEAMTDRTCIHTNGVFQQELSSDDILSCCGSMCGNGCAGGYPIEAWRWWVQKGVVTGGNYADKTTCRPYEIAPCGHHAGQTYYGPCPDHEYDAPKCTQACQSGYSKSYTADKHFGKTAYAVNKAVASIQTEVMTNGPVEAAFTVYEDFYQYKSGVYTHTSGKALGGHAVRILGWGTDNGTPYWLVANSWNTDWGENGYFRIIRGVNECGIEGAIVAGMPKE